MEENAETNGMVQNETEAEQGAVDVGSAVDYTELLEQIHAEQQLQTEAITEVKESVAESVVQMQTLNGSLMVVVAFVVIGFGWDCMRTWRRELLKIGEK